MSDFVHRYGTWPASTDAPLVLLHGFPLDSRMWTTVIGELPELPVIAVDLPGFGKASDAETPGGLEGFADALAQALADEGVQRAVVAGLSMGGYVAMALAQSHPQMLAGIGLLDTKASADAPEARANRLDVAQRALGDEGAAVVAPMIEALVGPTTAAHRPEVVAQLREWLAQAPPAGIARAQRAMAARVDRHAVLERLGSRQLPALVLRGSEDALATGDDHQKMAQALGTDVVSIEGAGHMSALEDPVPVAAALGELYRRAEA